jgi:hypothetical protein
MFRNRFDPSVGKKPWRQILTLFGQPLDDYLVKNIQGYSTWIEQRIAQARASVV